MEWPYWFELNGISYGDPCSEDNFPSLMEAVGDSWKSDTTINLERCIEKANEWTLFYGPNLSNWEHAIRVEKEVQLSHDTRYPLVIAGEHEKEQGALPDFSDTSCSDGLELQKFQEDMSYYGGRAPRHFRREFCPLHSKKIPKNIMIKETGRHP